MRLRSLTKQCVSTLTCVAIQTLLLLSGYDEHIIASHSRGEGVRRWYCVCMYEYVVVGVNVNGWEVGGRVLL